MMLKTPNAHEGGKLLPGNEGGAKSPGSKIGPQSPTGGVGEETPHKQPKTERHAPQKVGGLKGLPVEPDAPTQTTGVTAAFTAANQVTGGAGIGQRVVDLVSTHHEWLKQRGSLEINSGIINSEAATIAFHTDYGPLGQDKETNQDYVLVWHGRQGSEGSLPCVAIAMGDGLGSSFRSELASATACSVALRSLVEQWNPASPRATFEAAIATAVLALKNLVAELARDPQASCPPGQFLSTWKFMLNRGKLLQTTLTLVWLQGDWLRVAIIGDGGFMWRTYDPPATEVPAQCDLGTQEVNALGAAAEDSLPLDHYFERRFSRPFLAALFTDGVGRGLGTAPTSLLDTLEFPALPSESNPAQEYLKEAIVRNPRAFEDNLTLAVIRAPAAAPR